MKILWNLLGGHGVASSRVRGYWVEEHLRASGAKSEWIIGGSRSDMFRISLRMCFVDAVIFQKQYSRWHVWLARLGRLLGRTVIFDIDDAPSRSKNPKTLKNVEKMMEVSSVVTAGCQKLCDYASAFNANVVLISSCIKLADYDGLAGGGAADKFTLGWIGNGSDYAKDLIAILAAPLRLLAAERPLRFRIVGACGQGELLEEAFGDNPNLDLELIDQIDWGAPGATRDAMRGVDVGLYPLLENSFNPSKCGFKALEYMALGLPVVASPVAANADIVRDGIDGRLCSTSAEWVQALRELADEPDLREAMGSAGRGRVEAEYSTEVAAQKLVGIIGAKGLGR